MFYWVITTVALHTLKTECHTSHRSPLRMWYDSEIVTVQDWHIIANNQHGCAWSTRRAKLRYTQFRAGLPISSVPLFCSIPIHHYIPEEKKKCAACVHQRSTCAEKNPRMQQQRVRVVLVLTMPRPIPRARRTRTWRCHHHHQGWRRRMCRADRC